MVNDIQLPTYTRQTHPYSSISPSPIHQTAATFSDRAAAASASSTAMARSELVMALLVAVLAAGCCASAGAVAYLSKLPVALDVTASPSPGQVLHAGEDVITVTWALNATRPAGDDAAYKNVKVSLCYAPASQKEREWRKTHDDLKKDKTCQFKVAQQPYAGAGGRVEYRVALDIPTATYYVRAYVLDASGAQVAYGQTAPAAAFNVVSITGVTTSIKVAAGVFSTFSVVSLAFFFFIEKRKKNN
ncbi:hypothetical protein ACQJBY_061460 [Aegilops geniculata]